MSFYMAMPFFNDGCIQSIPSIFRLFGIGGGKSSACSELRALKSARQWHFAENIQSLCCSAFGFRIIRAIPAQVIKKECPKTTRHFVSRFCLLTLIAYFITVQVKHGLPPESVSFCDVLGIPEKAQKLPTQSWLEGFFASQASNLAIAITDIDGAKPAGRSSSAAERYSSRCSSDNDSHKLFLAKA